jgi:hypothetical protein
MPGLNYGGGSGARTGGGCTCTCVKSQMASLITLFLSLSLSFVLLIIAGTVPNGSWVPMINIIAVVFMPIFILLADTMGAGGETVLHNYDENKVAWNNFGYCFLGLVAASMLGLPLILLHATIINNQAFAYWIASVFVAVAGGVRRAAPLGCSSERSHSLELSLTPLFINPAAGHCGVPQARARSAIARAPLSLFPRFKKIYTCARVRTQPAA